ncbi:hypothetical protein [Streptomyces sp. NPDC014733]|uniref:hypothetical protein n=1 Tax=Streptomyces sp. NPDC014733 TaxID=3364885 RepID=UPI0036F92463
MAGRSRPSLEVSMLSTMITAAGACVAAPVAGLLAHRAVVRAGNARRLRITDGIQGS